MCTHRPNCIGRFHGRDGFRLQSSACWGQQAQLRPMQTMPIDRRTSRAEQSAMKLQSTTMRMPSRSASSTRACCARCAATRCFLVWPGEGRRQQAGKHWRMHRSLCSMVSMDGGEEAASSVHMHPTPTWRPWLQPGAVLPPLASGLLDPAAPLSCNKKGQFFDSQGACT